MSGFPPVFTDDPNLQAWMTMVEESITQLASQHGVTNIRENITLTGPNLYSTTPPTKNTLYPDTMIKAWAHTSALGQLISGCNLSVIPGASAGIYLYSFLTPPDDGSTDADLKHAIIATAGGTYGQWASFEHAGPPGREWQFIIFTSDDIGAPGLVNAEHTVLVLAHS